MNRGGCFVSPVISLMARLSGIPRRNYVAKCANVLYTYQLEYSTPDAIQAVLDLIQQGNPGESAEMYLAHHSSSRTRKDRREKKQNHPTAGLLLSPDAKTNVRMGALRHKAKPQLLHTRVAFQKERAVVGPRLHHH